ncbi:MAG: hypothetical protein JRI36_13725 [Deltaproteobacteria bacterium]|nr:hypothetical protein [Deltaproteobacteria bacterium]
MNNPRLGLTPVGFIDDDVKKHKRRIQGYQILGGRDRLADFIPKYRINEVIVASGAIRPENFKAACTVCSELGVTLRCLELSINRMADLRVRVGHRLGGEGQGPKTAYH